MEVGRTWAHNKSTHPWVGLIKGQKTKMLLRILTCHIHNKEHYEQLGE